MSIDRGVADFDMSDVSVSESSWADAQADTPTMGEGRSDSEDTLSNLSFDNVLDNQQDPVVENNFDNEVGVDVDPALLPIENEQGVKNDEVVAPIPAPRNSLQQKQSVDTNGIRVCVTDVDLDMDQDNSQIDLPPGTEYKPPSLDIARSPSQLKITRGAEFMPKEEPGAVSEDESSVSSYQAQLDLNLRNGDVRLTKKDDETKSAEETASTLIIPEIHFELDDDPPDNPTESFQSSGEPSLIQEASDVLDDYIEDFYMPLSHETVMSRQTSFRRKVQKQLETVAAEKAVQELDKFEAMLATYDEDEENGVTPPGSPFNMKKPTPGCKSCELSASSSGPCAECRNKMAQLNKLKSMQLGVNKLDVNGVNSGQSSNGHVTFNPDLNGISRFQQLNSHNSLLEFDEEYAQSPSLNLDIDAIVDENAPNLMGLRKNSESFSGLENCEESMSNYFLPQQTLDKLYSVYESSNFNNIYCLSGELKDILSATEMEEIIANKEHLEKVIDPNVIAALSWSLNDPSLPYIPNDKVVSHHNQVNTDKSNKLNVPLIMDSTSEKSGLLKSDSKSSSMSNGFHSDASEDDNLSNASSSSFGNNGGNKSSANIDKKMVPVRDEYLNPDSNGFPRGALLNNSFRRRVALRKKNDKELDISQGSDGASESPTKRSSLESLDDLGVGDDIDWEDDDTSKDDKSSGIVLVRRDSKRFSFKGTGTGDDRYIEGLFVESKNPNPNGTLKRIRAPLNFSEDMGDGEPSLEFQNDSESDKNRSSSDASGDISSEDGVKHQKVHKKKISVDDKILSVVSAELDDSSQATDVTESDVFHSIINTLRDDDDTMKTENGDDEDDITLDIDTPDDMEESIMEQLESITTSPNERIPELSAEEEMEDSRRWKSFRVGPNDIQIDLKAIQPYRRVLSHGGYLDVEQKVAIILFSGCFLPDRSRKEYTYLMDHLFLYVLSTLEELIVEDYILVYLHGATPKSCMPTFTWLKRCYQLIDRRLRKNLKALYLVHPTFWLKTIVALTKPFVSSKFSRKVQFINTLSDLCLEIPTEHLVIPDRVLQYDFDLKVYDLKRRNVMS